VQAVTKRGGSPFDTGVTQVDILLIAWYFPPILRIARGGASQIGEELENFQITL